MKKIKVLSVILLTVLVGTNVKAQEKRVAQVSFIYPVGSAGVKSFDYANSFSFNIIGGVNGGLNGVELGSVVNVNKGDVIGCQISGVCNLTSGNSKGCIISGVANVTKSNTDGTAISGVANISGSHKGLQLSTINIVKDSMLGSQIGVVNCSKSVKGIQIGVVNICGDNNNILPIGLFNIVKNGYYAFEVSTNEIFLTSLSYKMGKELFYSIFRTSIGEHNKKPVFSTGFGFGSILPINRNHKMNMELICDELYYNWKFDENKQSNLGQFNLNYHYQITKHLAVELGPSFKTLVTFQKDKGEFVDAIKIPHTLFEHECDKYKVSGWIGINLGVTLSL